jgi:hypothetical protein
MGTVWRIPRTFTALDIVPLEVFQFHELDLGTVQADKKTALEAFNSLLVERSASEVLTVLRVAKEILAAVDEAKNK